MVEKVIFQFRARQTDGGTQYEIKHPREGIAVRYPSAMGVCLPFIRWMPSKPARRRARAKKAKSRNHMRRRLDFYEKLYQDMYGGDDYARSIVS